MNKLKRYLLFLAGLFVNALGVSLVTKASLGTSPISSIPYVLSLNYPLTLGNFTIIFSIFLILLQLLILRKNFKIENVLQIPVSIAFGYFIDLTMYMFFWVDPQNYVVKLISLLAGCVVLGFGVYMEVLADVVMLPGESFVRAIVQTWNTNFGTTKIIFDSSMTIMAGVLSVLFSVNSMEYGRGRSWQPCWLVLSPDCLENIWNLLSHTYFLRIIKPWKHRMQATRKSSTRISLSSAGSGVQRSTAPDPENR